MSLIYIANKLGVSTATVSNVINGKGRASQDVQDKILALLLAEKIDIKRRRKKRNTSTKRYIALAVTERRFFLDDIAFHEQLLKGIRSILEPRGYALLLPSATLTPRNIRDETRDADAALLIGFDHEPEQFVSATAVPVVWLCRAHCDSADIIHEDHKEIGRLAARRLFDHGHRVVGFIDDRRVESLTEKGLFFSHFMEEFGGKVITVTGNVFLRAGSEGVELEQDTLRRLLIKLLAKKNNVTALFIPGNRVFADVAAILGRMGKHYGSPLEILPCVSSIPVTGDVHAFIDINLEEIGKRAAECALWRIDNPNASPMRVTVRPNLIKSG